MRIPVRLFATLVGAALCAVSCQSMYYSAMEKVGVHKRDILVERVEDARDSQTKAKEEFKGALTLFTEVVEIKDSQALKRKYTTLSEAFQRSGENPGRRYVADQRYGDLHSRGRCVYQGDGHE